MSRNRTSLCTSRVLSRAPEHAELERYARDRDAVDPCERMAGLVADAALCAPLSMGQQLLLVERLRAAGAELVEFQPYLRRGVDDLLDLVETLDVAVLYDAAITFGLGPLETVLYLAHRLENQDEEVAA